MIGSLWFQLNAINKGKARPEGFGRAKIDKLGILGAGMMGAGIAYVSAKAGIEVVLLDTTQDAADKGTAYSTGLLDKDLKKARITVEGKTQLPPRLKATPVYHDLTGSDLIRETAFKAPPVNAHPPNTTK